MLNIDLLKKGNTLKPKNKAQSKNGERSGGGVVEENVDLAKIYLIGCCCSNASIFLNLFVFFIYPIDASNINLFVYCESGRIKTSLLRIVERLVSRLLLCAEKSGHRVR